LQPLRLSFDNHSFAPSSFSSNDKLSLIAGKIIIALGAVFAGIGATLFPLTVSYPIIFGSIALIALGILLHRKKEVLSQVESDHPDFGLHLNTEPFVLYEEYKTLPIGNLPTGLAHIPLIPDFHQEVELILEYPDGTSIFSLIGGMAMAEYVKDKFDSIFTKQCQKSLSMEKILRETLKELHGQCQQQEFGASATLLLVVKKENHLWTANIGCCQALFIPNNERAFYLLSRETTEGTLGGQKNLPSICITKMALEKKSGFLVLYSNGVAMKESPTQVEKLVFDNREKETVEIAKELVTTARRAGSPLDTTAIIVKIT
jgi:hypothetical protein